MVLKQKEWSEMTKYNLNIEHLQRKGLTGFIMDSERMYTNYYDFAVAAGYPDAVLGNENEDTSRSQTYNGLSFNVLARGTHETFGTTIFVAELASGERILISLNGVALDEAQKPRDLSEMDYVELAELVTDIASERRSRAFGEGYDAGYKDGKGELDSSLAPSPNPTMTREEVIKKAKSDVELLTENMSNNDGNLMGNFTYQSLKSSPEYVINKEKRTVVALVRFHGTEAICEKGIAKCDPDDCFNSHIGGAIALHRALGLMVPHVYLKAPQPTEAQDGDVIAGDSVSCGLTERRIDNNKMHHSVFGETCSLECDFVRTGAIIDDSRE